MLYVPGFNVVRRGCLDLCAHAPNAVLRNPPGKPTMCSRLDAFDAVLACTRAAWTASNLALPPNESFVRVCERRFESEVLRARFDYAGALEVANEAVEAAATLPNSTRASFNNSVPFAPKEPTHSSHAQQSQISGATAASDPHLTIADSSALPSDLKHEPNGGGAVDLAEAAAAPRLLGRCFLSKGRAHLELGQFSEALRCARRAEEEESAAAAVDRGFESIRPRVLVADVCVAALKGGWESARLASGGGGAERSAGEEGWRSVQGARSEENGLRRPPSEGSLVAAAREACEEALRHGEFLRAADAPRALRLSTEDKSRMRDFLVFIQGL